jgi:hypothetical protein
VYNYSFNTFRYLAQYSQPLRRHNTSTQHARCKQTVTCSAAAAAGLTLHGANEIPIERDKRTGCVWRSAPQSTKRQGAKVKRTPNSLNLKRSSTFIRNFKLLYYFTIFHEVFNTIHKSVPLCKEPKIPRPTSRKTTYLPVYLPTILTTNHSLRIWFRTPR